MESKIASSFIPKDTMSNRPVTKTPGSGNAFDLLLFGTIILLIASVALAVGVFLYVQFLETSRASKAEQIQRAQEAFEPALIAELTRLDDRMKAGQDVLQAHIAPSELFNALETLTLQTVSFETMDFQATEANAMTVQLSGRARSVNSIALQADLFGQDPTITSPIFSNITRENDGVRFDVGGIINPLAIRYVNVFANRNAPTVLPAQTPPDDETDIPFFAP